MDDRLEPRSEDPSRSEEPPGAGGRWAELFADLEAQWDAEHRRDLTEEVADRTRRERAGIGLVDRLGAFVGRGAARPEIGIRLLGGEPLRGRLEDVGDGWLLLAEAAGRSSALVPFDAVASVLDLPPRVGGPQAGRRFGFGYALRALSRDRRVVSVLDRGGQTCVGTIDAVGADVMDLSEHAADLARRDANVRARLTIPFSAIAVVRST